MARTKQTARKSTGRQHHHRTQLSAQRPDYVAKRAPKPQLKKQLSKNRSSIPPQPQALIVDHNRATLVSDLASSGRKAVGREGQPQAALTMPIFHMRQTPESQEVEASPRPFQALTLMLEESLEDDEQLGARLKLIVSNSVELAKRWQTTPVREVNSQFERFINFVLDTAKGARQNLYQNQDNLVMRLRNAGAEEEIAEIIHRLNSWQCTSRWEDLSLDSKFDKTLVTEANDTIGIPLQSDPGSLG